MKKRLTSFNITETASTLEDYYIQKLDITKTSFHRRMIDYFLENIDEITLDERLLITNTNDPDYVHKRKKEQIYLDQEREEKLNQSARYFYRTTGKDIGITIILFQALLSYLTYLHASLLTEIQD